MTGQEPFATRLLFPQEVTGGGVVLTLLPGQLFASFADILSSAEIDALLRHYRLQQVEGASGLHLHGEIGAAPFRRRRLRLTAAQDTTSVIAQIRADSRVRTASPVYHRADLLPVETATSFSDQVLVHFGPHATEEEVTELIEALETENVTAQPLGREGVLYQLRLRLPKQQDIFAICDKFAQSPLVRHAGPDWIQLQSPASIVIPNDAQFSQQWNLVRIAAPNGWDYTQGTRHVVIAIIDSGCELGHPDLVGKYVPVADRFDVLTGTNFPNDNYHHGTLCAGVAAAQTDNTIGVAGVAPDCLIMPIRLYNGVGPNPGIQSQADIVAAINWAVTHGADVINMSWFYNLPHQQVDIALGLAYEANVVLVAASGNCEQDKGCPPANPGGIDYPATHPDVIAVGASDQNDRRFSNNASNPGAWRSRFGPELSVIAPGIDCWTTELTTWQPPPPLPGYNMFFGTSAAAPHVAGLAALLLSLRRIGKGKYEPVPFNPDRNDLTNDQVRYFIETTTDKVPGYGYSKDPSHPHGIWNEEVGYGRINVDRALARAWDYINGRKRATDKYALAVTILVGLTSDGSGVVLPPGGQPVPVDPGWLHLMPDQRDVLLGLAVTVLAEQANDRETRRALERAGWNAIERAAKRMG